MNGTEVIDASPIPQELFQRSIPVEVYFPPLVMVMLAAITLSWCAVCFACVYDWAADLKRGKKK